MTAREPIEPVEAGNWNLVENSDIPVFVEFWADWCGPCHAMAPTIASLAGSLEGKVKFVKVDVDRSPEIASRFDVFSVPAFLVFENGKPRTRFVGMATREYMAKLIASERSE